MELFVIRHAIAEERSAERADEDRALTGRGRSRFAAAFAPLAAELELHRILSSPWRRASETAALIAEHLPVTWEETALLAAPPSGELYRRILALGGERVAVVGHQPWLGELIAELAFGDAELGDGLALKKGGIAWLSGTPEPGGMILRALLPPRWSLALGRAPAD